MTFTVSNFDQATLIEYGLNLQDAEILRWYVNFYSTDKMVKQMINGKVFAWVKYSAVIADLPILGITSKEVISRHFDRFVNCGIMEKYVKKVEGTYTMFCLTEKYNRLIEKSNGVDSKVERGVDSKVDPKDYNTNLNYNANNNIADPIKPDSHPINNSPKDSDKSGLQPVGFNSIDKDGLLKSRVKPDKPPKYSPDQSKLMQSVQTWFTDEYRARSKIGAELYLDGKQKGCIAQLCRMAKWDKAILQKKLALYQKVLDFPMKGFETTLSALPSDLVMQWNKLC